MNSPLAALCLLSICACIPVPSYGQQPFTSKVPCTDALLLSLKGQYREESTAGVELFSRALSAADVTQLKNRLRVVQQLVEDTIPPAGLEPFWKMAGGQYRFAHDSQNENGFPTLRASYLNFIQYYHCAGDDPNYVAYSGETGTILTVEFNAISSMTLVSEEEFLIEGRPVYRRNPVVGRWNGRDLYASCEREDCRRRSVLLHRPGMSPYVPVTRKQYLEFCSALVRRLTDPIVEWYKVNETEKLAGAIKGRDDATAKYRDELARTARENLLDAPAVVRESCTVLPDQPVFAAADEGGGELVTENPAYFRKDLPRYVPQIIWVQWSWNDYAAPRNFRRVFEASFPIEKLQAMIDK